VEINSPPFPKNSCNPINLFNNLRELYRWVADHREWANENAERMNAPNEPFVAELGPEPTSKSSERYVNLAVPDMFMSWQALRSIRERYDDIVRNYEEESDWNSDVCVFHRIQIVKAASLLLSIAFLDYEHREAKQAEMMKKSRKQFMRMLKKAFNEVKSSFESEEDDEEQNNDNQIDFDNLFNEEEE
jgi:hypothetical protein